MPEFEKTTMSSNQRQEFRILPEHYTIFALTTGHVNWRQDSHLVCYGYVSGFPLTNFTQRYHRQGMSCRILVVEDEAIVAVNLESTLSDLGHNVVGLIDNGLGAIRLAKTLQPEIIFMDIKLRGDLDGIDTAFFIDGVLEKPIAFIFVSAYPAEYFRPTITLKKYSWIQKPYTATEIEKAVKQSHSFL
jgi:CheY-like chemotaxis protein